MDNFWPWVKNKAGPGTTYFGKQHFRDIVGNNIAAPRDGVPRDSEGCCCCCCCCCCCHKSYLKVVVVVVVVVFVFVIVINLIFNNKTIDAATDTINDNENDAIPSTIGCYCCCYYYFIIIINLIFNFKIIFLDENHNYNCITVKNLN